ncbi:MAG: HAD superfamily hydrolase (TIGR01549 family) [Myxococcota bacterium]|jgi:HAD superfamily hydrolase (TIGR01549 family)
MTIRPIDRSSWIFDMDGTLTVPAHDFAGFKRDRGIPATQDLLSAANERSAAGRAELLAAISKWEAEVAASAVAQDDARDLLQVLFERGDNLAVVTRNTREHAMTTLQASGLLPFFTNERVILGRNCAPAKPRPDALLVVLDQWKVRATDAVMVGDWVHDVRAGRLAGCTTVLIERTRKVCDEWLPDCDHVIQDLRALQ